jgi:hypothetical protein
MTEDPGTYRNLDTHVELVGGCAFGETTSLTKGTAMGRVLPRQHREV